MSAERLKWNMATPVSFSGTAVLTARTTELAQLGGMTPQILGDAIAARFGEIPLVFTVDETAAATAEILGSFDAWFAAFRNWYDTENYRNGGGNWWLTDKMVETETREQNIITNTRREVQTDQSGTPSETAEQKISAFNSATYSPDAQTTTTGITDDHVHVVEVVTNTPNSTNPDEVTRDRQGFTGSRTLAEKAETFRAMDTLVNFMTDKFKHIFAVDMESVWNVFGGIEL